MSTLFSREEAMTFALAIVGALAPHSTSVEIAGSLRRGKTLVKDIDIIAIPKMNSTTALFGVSPELAETDFYTALKTVLLDVTAEGTKLIRGVAAQGRTGKLFSDIYIATPETWATILLIRTGSAEHNIWMCSRAKQVGGKFHADGAGLELPGQYDHIAKRTINTRMLQPKTEDEIFKALGIPCIDPREREIWNGKPAWMGNPTAEDLDVIENERRVSELTK